MFSTHDRPLRKDGPHTYRQSRSGKLSAKLQREEIAGETDVDLPIHWLAPVTTATAFDILMSPCFERMCVSPGTSLEDHDQLSARLVGLHHSVSFTDFLEAEGSYRLDVQPTDCGVRRDLLKRNV